MYEIMYMFILRIDNPPPFDGVRVFVAKPAKYQIRVVEVFFMVSLNIFLANMYDIITFANADRLQKSGQGMKAGGSATDILKSVC